jgi:drug/metabolite transporter (DMT)-like permease
MNLNPYATTVLAATIAATSGILIKTANLPSTTMTFFRLVVPTIIIFIILKLKKTIFFRGNYKIMLFSSLLNAIRLWFYILAFKYTSIGNGIIILFTWPIFASLFGIIFLKEKLDKKVGLLITTAFLGIIMVSIDKNLSFKNHDFVGMVCMLISAIVFALTTVIFKKESLNYSRMEIVFYQNFVGAIIFLPVVFVTKPFPTTLQTFIGIMYGILVGVVAFVLFFYSLKRLKISHYSVLTYWEVPCATVFGIIFFKETVSINMFIGGSLIFLAGILLVLDKNLTEKVL